MTLKIGSLNVSKNMVSKNNVSKNNADFSTKMNEFANKYQDNAIKIERGPTTTSFSFDSTPGTIPGDFVRQLKLYHKDKRVDRLKFLGYTAGAAAAAGLGFVGGLSTPKEVADQVAAMSNRERNNINIHSGAVLGGLALAPFGLESKKNKVLKPIALGLGIGALGALGKEYLGSNSLSKPQRALVIAGTIGTAITPYLIAKSGEAGQHLADEDLETDILNSDDDIAGKIRRVARVRNGVGINRVYPSTRFISNKLPGVSQAKALYVRRQENTSPFDLNKLHGNDQAIVYDKLKTQLLDKEVESYKALHKGNYPTSKKLLSMEKQIEKQILKEML